MGFGWEGEKVRLVPLDREKHLANAVAWFNDPAVTAWTLVGDWPLTRLAEEAYFEGQVAGWGPSPTEVAFGVETLQGEHIGFCGIHDIEYRHGVGRTGTVIGRSDFWRLGYGTEVCRVRARFAFEVLGLRMLLSEVMDGNEASLGMLTHVGYREVGRVPRRYFKRGAYRDALILALERDAFTP